MEQGSCAHPLNRSHFIGPVGLFSFHGREIFNLSLACCQPASPLPSLRSTQLHAQPPHTLPASRPTSKSIVDWLLRMAALF